MDLVFSIIHKTVCLIILETTVVNGMHVPLKMKDQGTGKENVTGSLHEIKPNSDKTRFIGQNVVGANLVQADGMKLEQETARNNVVVTKRAQRYREPWEINYNVCPPSVCIANEQQRPKVTGSSLFFDGDIILDKESEKIIYGNSRPPRHKRATTRNHRTWRNAIVPYIFARDIAPHTASVLKEAMRIIEKKTCIRFKRRKLRDEDYIRFISEPGCWANVGRVGGEQKVSLGLGCERLGIALHEILHALGYWHEQARPDRDRYVEIIKENIVPKYVPDFNKINPVLVSSRGFPYDYESVMHYGNKAFTNYGRDTIKVIGTGRKLKMRIGQRDALSNIDIAQLRDMYNCFNKETLYSYCPRGWVKIGRKCYKFEDKLMQQFSGAVKKCREMNSKLVLIEDRTEELNLKRYIKGIYPRVKVWRTGERIRNGYFGWYTGKSQEEMRYTHWEKSNPSSYSSLALVYNKKMGRMRWEGVWLGSYNAHAFICERIARRRCIPGQYLDGRDYRGNLDHTIGGNTCQKWSSQYPWAHKLLPFPYRGEQNKQDGLGDHNYCRNPSGDRKRRPWCYTTKSKYKWQYCDVSICSKKGTSAEYKKNDRSAKPNRKTNTQIHSNPKRKTNKPQSRPRSRSQQQTGGKASSQFIKTSRKRSKVNIRTKQAPKTRYLYTGKRGSSSNKRKGNRKKITRSKYRKSGRSSSSKRTSKSNGKYRKRKYQNSRQNVIAKL